MTDSHLQNIEDELDNNKCDSISVFFPCYNEEANVSDTVDKAVKVTEATGRDYEIIIVNDGSADATGRIADELAERYEHVKAVHHPTNLGYGAALQSGFRAASKKLVFYTDGDGQFDIGEMPGLLGLMRDYDIVSCYRLDRKDSFMRKLNGWAWTRLVCLLFKLRLRDIDCAFKLYPRRLFDQISPQSEGALIDVEVLAKAKLKGYRIGQVPVHHYPRQIGEQTGANLRVIARAFWELFCLYGDIRLGHGNKRGR